MKTNNLLAIVVALATLMPVTVRSQQGYDLAAAQKWATAKVVKYRVEGKHQARAPVVHGDYEGKGDVVDTVTLEFNWDMKKRGIVGAIAVTDGKTAVGNLKSDGTNCGPPQLKGDYEHFQSVSSSAMGNTVHVKGTRTYPAAAVSNYPASCSMHSIPGARVDAMLPVPVMKPEVLGMPIVAGGPFTVSADRKSVTVKGAENWVWTLTPTLVQ